jgi:hypothetical protein
LSLVTQLVSFVPGPYLLFLAHKDFVILDAGVQI